MAVDCIRKLWIRAGLRKPVYVNVQHRFAPIRKGQVANLYSGEMYPGKVFEKPCLPGSFGGL